MFRVQVDGRKLVEAFGELEKGIRKITSASTGPRGAGRVLAGYVGAMIRGNFKAKEFPSGRKWAPLKENYRKRKEGVTSKWGGDHPLIRSGMLIRAATEDLEFTSDSNGRFIFKPNQAYLQSTAFTKPRKMKHGVPGGGRQATVGLRFSVHNKREGQSTDTRTLKGTGAIIPGRKFFYLPFRRNPDMMVNLGYAVYLAGVEGLRSSAKYVRWNTKEQQASLKRFEQKLGFSTSKFRGLWTVSG